MMPNKYRAVRTWSELNQRWFASKKEAARADELNLLQRAGEIIDLEFQVKFILSEKPKITITIDFSYIEAITKKVIHEDSKGMLTRDTRTRLAWLKEKHGVTVILS